jgi:TolB-like protein/Tfp pilus assembly protein PilF
MTAHASTEFHLEIAHILFIDTVGYSSLRTAEQREIQKLLTKLVRGTECFRAAESEDKVIGLPTGDGMALVFSDSIEAPIICALQICETIAAHPHLKLRMGIHSGPVTRVSDVNDRSNFAGGAMNMAERVMSCADANHILLSKRAADDLAEIDRWRPCLHDIGECEGKHGMQLHIVNFFTDKVGNPALPLKFQTRAAPNRPETERPGYLRSRRHQIAFGALVLLIAAACIVYSVLRPSALRTPGTPVSTETELLRDKSIAVLPFESSTNEKSNVIFADGVQDEIQTDLGKVAALNVISRTSTMQYRSRAQRNLRDIGQALGASHVVEGTVQRDGKRVRVSVQLTDTRSNTQVWAESYERDVADAFALESELAETIVHQLQAKLSPEEKAAIQQEATSDELAHQLFLEGNALITAPLFNLQGTQNLFRAAELFEKAVARDPDYFRAYCKLASVHDQIYLYGPDHTPARLALANAAVKNAQRLRPDAGETHLALAEHLYCGFFDYDGARRELELARGSLPNEPLVFEYAGFIDRRQNRWNDSTKNLLRALELDPRNTYILHQLTVTYERLRQFDKAASMIERARKILPKDPGLRVAQASLALHAAADLRPMHDAVREVVAQDPNAVPGIANESFYLALCERDPSAARQAIAVMPSEGHTMEGFLFPRAWCEALAARAAGDAATEQSALATARAQVEGSLRNDPAHAEPLSILGMIDAALGRKDDAIREAKRAVELLPLEKDSINGPLAIEFLAITYAWSAETDLALVTLKKAASIPGYVTYGDLRLHPFWDPLRGDPRFDKIVDSLAPIDGKKDRAQ